MVDFAGYGDSLDPLRRQVRSLIDTGFGERPAGLVARVDHHQTPWIHAGGSRLGDPGTDVFNIYRLVGGSIEVVGNLRSVYQTKSRRVNRVSRNWDRDASGGLA